MRVEILCTGDEILTGKTINTNYSHIARRLVEVGLGVHWGTTVGDDRESLLQAFHQAGERADAVIVNGGLGPTVDDLSQEVAAEACGVELVLSDYWMTRMAESYARRGRVMPPNNQKQAMLPENAEFIDNPIGTACGFAVTIGKARFFFTPGVPREMRRMLDEQVIPRLLAMSGIKGVTRLKRFHTFGIGESRADEMLGAFEAFKRRRRHQARLPGALSAARNQARGARRRRGRRSPRGSAPVEAEVRKRLGNFIVAEDEQTLEGVILGKLLEQRRARSPTAEMITGGHLAARLAPLAGAETCVPARHRRARSRRARRDRRHARCGGRGRQGIAHGEQRQPRAGRCCSNSTKAPTGPTWAARSASASPTPSGAVTRQARLVGGRDWVRIGATELGLDCLRRHLLGLPVDERIDFERR